MVWKTLQNSREIWKFSNLNTSKFVCVWRKLETWWWKIAIIIHNIFSQMIALMTTLTKNNNIIMKLRVDSFRIQIMEITHGKYKFLPKALSATYVLRLCNSVLLVILFCYSPPVVRYSIGIMLYNFKKIVQTLVLISPLVPIVKLYYNSFFALFRVANDRMASKKHKKRNFSIRI